MQYLFGLTVVLAGIWIALSGHFDPLLLSLGAIAVLTVMVLSVRMKLIDRVAVPYFRLPGFFFYWGWLIKEIAKANVGVVRACLKAELDISPALVKIKTRCKSDMAKTVFANSITLTPGTVTIDVEGDKLLVHALYEANAQPEAFVVMDRLSQKASEGALP